MLKTTVFKEKVIPEPDLKKLYPSQDSSVCDRIENSDRTGTGPDYKPENVNRIQPDWPDFYRILKL